MSFTCVLSSAMNWYASRYAVASLRHSKKPTLSPHVHVVKLKYDFSSTHEYITQRCFADYYHSFLASWGSCYMLTWHEELAVGYGAKDASGFFGNCPDSRRWSTNSSIRYGHAPSSSYVDKVGSVICSQCHQRFRHDDQSVALHGACSKDGIDGKRTWPENIPWRTQRAVATCLWTRPCCALPEWTRTRGPRGATLGAQTAASTCRSRYQGQEISGPVTWCTKGVMHELKMSQPLV